MDCWSLLQLPEDTDARSIKRSYARLLKVFRPDEDPEGFQRLREAYEEALDIARWRAEQAADEPEETGAEPLPMLEQADAGNLRAWSDLLELAPLNPGALNQRPLHSLDLEPRHSQPLPRDSTVQDTEQTARALLEGLSQDNLSERWEQAQQQNCAQAFERRLLRFCFNHPGLRSSVAGWAVLHLDWLTPWQRVSMSEGEQDALANCLLQDYRQTAQERLEAKQEREFLALIKNYSAQPWLQVFDRQQQWQQIILQLFNDTEWSVPLFDRVAQVFGWDDQKGIHPEPAWIWQALIERCKQESFYQSQRAKSESDRHWAADVQAARLLMTPMSPTQQKKMINGFGANEWQACQDLAHNLKWRYPQLLSRLPCADVFFWQQFLPRPIAAQTWVRVWAGIALALWLYYCGSDRASSSYSLLVPATVFACVPVWFLRFALIRWVPITSYFFVLDLWLTGHIVPKAWDPDSRWLLLRHGVPQVVMLLLFGFLLGGLGMATYLGFMLIGFVHKRRLGELDPEFCARHPWLTALHWAHFSPLQVVFLLVMVGITLFCQINQTGFPLTRLLPG
ncbi:MULTISPECIES: J domain-containing protein [unclassified Pseudomonas]|uniref:J domain-containing protein n=1 Tax=unclassified Pseudomonas TaxID=196821 RepID=UPI002AC9CDF8|nr:MULTISPECIES: J domain-containing protein [unclassified Pseudomonas]MEB0047617.1 J domain-containing protein [Pseudomonas sp. Dout3]MEB0098927.1 J domain-containing protein [Pseudomonas sp. DC1.2]WPX58066.1 J domain-containing protein [Pseudomonas sp. DC1.2]